eukprot:SAG31_NODE_38_length_31498_cov_41.930539_8_plen_35_part_00
MAVSVVSRDTVVVVPKLVDIDILTPNSSSVFVCM